MPEGRGGPNPFFAKIKIGYFDKISFASDSLNDLEKSSKNFHTSSVRLKVVPEPHQFLD